MTITSLLWSPDFSESKTKSKAPELTSFSINRAKISLFSIIVSYQTKTGSNCPLKPF